MSNNFQVSVQGDIDQKNVAVLKIASAAKNSITQFFSEKVQISIENLADLDAKLQRKINSHRLADSGIIFSMSIQFANDKSITLDRPQLLAKADLKIPAETQLITAKWAFSCDLDGDGSIQSHAIYLRMAERPHPALLLQKAISGNNEDLEELDNEAFSTISCKVDFIDGIFSDELLKIVKDWVQSLPRAESTFGVVRWLEKQDGHIHNIMYGVLPCIVMLGYAGIWIDQFPNPNTPTIKQAVAWIICGAVVFESARFTGVCISQIFRHQLAKINNVPVFSITSGDKNKMTAFLARSHRSTFKLAGTGLIFGIIKGGGIYFSTSVLKSIFG